MQQMKEHGMDLGRWEQRALWRALVMPNGISARYQGKTYDSTFIRVGAYLCIKLGGTAVAGLFLGSCPSRDTRTGAFSYFSRISRG